MDLQTDIHKLKIGQDGVDNFYWPISMAEHEQFGYDLIVYFCEIVREKDKEPESIYKLLGLHFVCEAIGVFQGDLLRDRCKIDNVTPLVDPDWRLWPYLFQGCAPVSVPFLDNLRMGPNKKQSFKNRFHLSRLKRIIKAIGFSGEGLSVSGMKLKSLTDDVLKSDIIACQRTDTIARHAAMVEKDVVFSRSNRWFGSVDDAVFEEMLAQADDALEAEIIGAIERLYNQNGIDFPDHSRLYLAGFLKKGAALLKVHRKRLLTKYSGLPENLWIGSSGNIWDRLLVNAVKTKGGIVEAHDHAMGQGVYGLPLTVFAEFWDDDYFWTYNERQKQGLLNNGAMAWALLSHKVPEIKCLAPKTLKSATSFDKARSDKRKTIAIMSTIYDCDRGRVDPVPPNVVSVDWQARLISKLASWGYDVVLKMHPESPVKPPAVFESELGARIVYERFEDVIHEFDIVMFDYIYTTTFRTVLETDIPIVISDYYHIKWSPGVRGVIEKRCEIIEGGTDHDNRVTFDWDKLRRGLEQSFGKTDNKEFLVQYLG